MEIRQDLKPVEHLISRLISIGKEFEAMDNRWSHMKNNEDFDKVWLIEDKQKKYDIEEVYATGRDMALFMSEALQTINFNFTTYPTLTLIITRFKGTWIDLDLNKVIEKGNKAHDDLGLNNWAFRQMVEMFNDQLNLLKAVKQTLNLLKESDLYKLENGIPMKEEKSSGVTISNITNSNIAVSSDNANQNIEQSGDLFIKLKEAIESADIENKDELISSVQDMEVAVKSGSIAEPYKNFISLAANHVSIIAPFLPALTALL